MHRIPAVELIFLAVQTLAVVGLVVRLVTARLHRIYPFFCSYLVLTLLQSAVLAAVPYDSFFYRYVWVATALLIDCLQALVVLELYSVVLRDLGGFAKLARRYIRLAFAIAVVVSLLMLGLEKTPKGIVGASLIVDRVIVVALVLLVLLITAFLVYYPIQLNRNTVVYSIGFAVYFLAKAAGRLLVNMKGSGYGQVNMLLVVVPTACLIYWMVSLSRKGEERTVVIGHRWNPEEEERLVSQLKEINASLLRAARK